MATLQKIAISFLVSVLLFGVFAVFAFTGLFDLLEARFYNPSITASITRDCARKAEIADNFFEEMVERFSEPLRTQAVRRSFLSNQISGDILERERIFKLLTESLTWIQWVRFIDPVGGRVHFSSHHHDVQHHDGDIQTYHSYNDPYFPYEKIGVKDGEAPRFTFDGRLDRILISFPLYDSFDIYCGTALYSFSIDALADRLISDGIMKFGQEITVISNPPGLLFGTTSAGESALPSQVSPIWQETGQKIARLTSPISGHSLVLVSAKTSQGIFIGRIVSEELFSIPPIMKVILLASFFITVFLTIFLLLNSRQDPVTIVQNRLKHLQISLIEQFYELKGETDWAHWIQELDLRRDEIVFQLKQGINTVSDSESNDIDVLINKSWDELLEVLGGRKEGGIDEKKLQSILKRILSDFAENKALKPSRAGLIQGQASAAASGGAGRRSLLMRATAIVKELEETEEVEELEEMEEPGITIEEPSSNTFEAIPRISREDIEELASKIEFSPDKEQDYAEEESINEDLEIVSPFSSMLFDFSASTAAKKGESLTSESEIIEELEGVPHINEEALSQEPDAALDPDFKNLVDSVVGPKN